jgi:hypothetical protein
MLIFFSPPPLCFPQSYLPLVPHTSTRLVAALWRRRRRRRRRRRKPRWAPDEQSNRRSG